MLLTTIYDLLLAYYLPPTTCYLLPAHQLYIKHAVDTVEVQSNWGRVFYTNLWACLISGGITLVTEPQACRLPAHPPTRTARTARIARTARTARTAHAHPTAHTHTANTMRVRAGRVGMGGERWAHAPLGVDAACLAVHPRARAEALAVAYYPLTAHALPPQVLPWTEGQNWAFLTPVSMGALGVRCINAAYAHRMHMHTACVCTPHAYAHRMRMHTACICTPHAYAHRMRMHTAYHPWRVLGACGHRSRACSGWRCRTLPSWRARVCRPRCSQSSATSARWVARIVNACKEGCIDAMHRRHA